MLIAFQRAVGTTITAMIVEPDGDWDLLKVRMCREWGIEDAFDRHRAWKDLRRGHTILESGELYQVIAPLQCGCHVGELFQTHRIDLISENE